MLMSQVLRAFLLILSGLLLTLNGGCASSQSSKFYMLESMSRTTAAEGSTPLRQNISVGLGPVTIPDYLDRPQIVTRTNQHSVLLAEFDRWAEPLSGNISRTLAENLSSLLQTDTVVLYPWPGSVDIAYQVLVDVFRFDGESQPRNRLGPQRPCPGQNSEMSAVFVV